MATQGYRITVRLNQADADRVRLAAQMLGISQAELIRRRIQANDLISPRPEQHPTDLMMGAVDLILRAMSDIQGQEQSH